MKQSKINIVLKSSLLIIGISFFILPTSIFAFELPTPYTSKTSTTAKKVLPPAKKVTASAKNVEKTAANVNKPKPTDAPIAEVDTAVFYDYMDYPAASQIGKVISQYGATEICQKHGLKGYSDYSMLKLPARIARVAKGDKVCNISKVQSLLGGDMIGYFELSRKLDTPLKRKAFSSDPDYQWFVDEFDAVRSQINQHVFFVAMPIRTEYNINSGTFTIPLPFYKDRSHKYGVVDYANQLADNIFMAPGSNVAYNSNITFEVEEATAIKIEGRGCSFVLMGRFDPELKNLESKDFKASDAILFEPFECYIVHDSDGEIITKMVLQSMDYEDGVGSIPEDFEDGVGSIPEEFEDGVGDLITVLDMISVDPVEYEYVYEGRIGNDPIMLCYLKKMDEIEGVEVLGFYKNNRTGEIFAVNGVKKNIGKVSLHVLNYQDDLVGEFLLDTRSSDNSLHGSFMTKPECFVSEVHLRPTKTTDE